MGYFLSIVLVAVSMAGAIVCGIFTSGVLDSDHKSHGGGGDDPLLINTPSYTKVQQSMKVVGTVKRKLPETSDFGNGPYPVYGTRLEATDEKKSLIYDENVQLRATDTTYDTMDKDGNLYLNGESIGRKLFKHTAAAGMYYGDVSDTEKAVIKTITVRPRPLGNYITGLYAPAGEVIKIEVSEEDLKATDGIYVAIGQASQRNHHNVIPKDRDFNRMPAIVNFMSVKSTVGYVGNYFGGPIYISPIKTCSEFTVKISGAVEYMHLIYGLTTKEEFEKMKKLSAPYFDLEVWDNSNRHSGPRKNAITDYDTLMKAAELWLKISLVSKQIPTGSHASVGITFLYDPYVAAGAACAWVGANWINAPPDWMGGSLNYDSFAKIGSWGNVHEFNHHFQRFGVGDGGEVTNNAVNILSYVLYTYISSARTLDDKGVGGWNRYTDPSRSIRETLASAKGTEPQTALNLYVDLIHSFGVDNFIKAAQAEGGKQDADSYYKALCDTMKYDFTYYFESILKQTLNETLKEEIKQLNYPVFVPIATIFQTGRSYVDNGKEVFIETVKPFVIPKGSELEMNFEERLFVPEGFTYKIKDISKPQSGTITKVNDTTYKYTPGNEKFSGNMRMVVTLTHESITTPDVTLTLNIQQRELKAVASIYKYDTNVYNTTEQAIAANFAGFTENNTYETSSHFINGINQNWVGLIEGRIYVPETGRYVLCYRTARGNNALYLSNDKGSTYNLVLNLTGNHNTFVTSGESTLEMNLTKGEYIYFKEVTVSTTADAYMELGWGMYDEEGNVAVNSISTNYVLGKKEEIVANFTSPSPYRKHYSLDSIDYTLLNQKCVSLENFKEWDETRLIEFGIDGDLSTAFHSDANNFVNANNPFILTVDIGQEIECDTFTIHGYNGNVLQMPITFELYGGLTQDSMELLKNCTKQEIVNKKVIVNFDKKRIRYYKLYVTESDTGRYVAFQELTFGLKFEGGEEYSPDYILSYVGFQITYTISSFGHIIKGSGTIEHKFTGKQFGLFVIQDEDCTIEVDIDGTVTTYTLKKANEKELGFLSNVLDNKEHQMKIKVVSGVLSVESFILR